MKFNAFKKFDLTGRTAVITAGGTGLGYYQTRGLLGAGAKVLIASRNEQTLASSAAKLREETNGEVAYATVDLADRESIRRFCEKALDLLGRVDIFVGNAAQDYLEPIENVTPGHIDAIFQVNVSSIIEMMQAFLPGMRANKWGRIILSSSTTSINPPAGLTIYTATKGALNSLTKSAAVEAGHDGITVNGVLFGMYTTQLAMDAMAKLDALQPGGGAAFVKAVASLTALGRLGRPDEVEGLFQFLASDASSYITGSHIVASGGHSIMGQAISPPENPVYPPEY